jgi:hypothetical protein
MSTISASTTSTTAYKVTADTTGALVLQTGATPTTALTLSTAQNATFAGTVADPTGTLRPLVSGTAVASTSGTSIDFTSIPSWVKRITVMFNGVSGNGTSNFLFQIGDSGGIENTGYSGGSFNAGATANSTAGFDLTAQNAAAQLWGGSITLTNLSGNIWCQSGVISGGSSGYIGASGGSKTLSDVLTQIRLTTVNGTDTFDAGTVNILYEG